MTTYEPGYVPEEDERRGCGPAATACLVLALSSVPVGVYLLRLHPLLGLGMMVGLLVLGVWLSMRRDARLDREEAVLHESAVRSQSCGKCGGPYSDGGTVRWCKLSGRPLVAFSLAKCGRCGTESAYGIEDTFVEVVPPKS